MRLRHLCRGLHALCRCEGLPNTCLRMGKYMFKARCALRAMLASRARLRTITSAVCVSEGVCCTHLVWLRSRAITFAVAHAVTLQLSTRKSARGRPRALLVAGRVSYSSLDLESDDICFHSLVRHRMCCSRLRVCGRESVRVRGRACGNACT